MVSDEIDGVFEELEELLDAERLALVSGELNQVERLFEQKSRLLNMLERENVPTAPAFSVVRAKLLRNQDLLSSAADGVRSVTKRLAAIKRVRESLDTYDATGRRKSVDMQTTGTLERRA